MKRVYGVDHYKSHYNKFELALNALFCAYETNTTAPDYFDTAMHSTAFESCAGTSTTTSYGFGYDDFIMENNMFEVEKSELETYLAEPVLPKGTAAEEMRFDILSWWKNHSAKYPILSRIARDVLVVPVTSVASESMFSIGGRVLTSHRSSLAPDLVEALLCLGDWLPDLTLSESNSCVTEVED